MVPGHAPLKNEEGDQTKSGGQQCKVYWMIVKFIIEWEYKSPEEGGDPKGLPCCYVFFSQNVSFPLLCIFLL